MRGPKPAYPITLTTQESEHFEELIRAHTTPQALAMRARIIVRANAHPEESNQQIARAVGPQIARCGPGELAGSRPIRWPTSPQWSAEAFSPLRYERKSPLWPVASPSRLRCLSLVGVGLSWLVTWPKIQLFLPYLPATIFSC